MLSTLEILAYDRILSGKRASTHRMGASNVMNKVRIARLDKMDTSTPAHALVANVDLVVVHWPDEDEVTVQ
jgi:hypothetical protein